ncbi:putative homocitrate synthase [Hypoxylon argillaceum]|nr:putative homocitrate synthase [Hypoxylon argillaceum]KAI1150481.1 putative homocitrate synthase [Nemania diffusa]
MSITGNSTSNPYSSVSDLLSNVRNFKIIECNATMLSEFGCDYIELTNPAASPQSRDDCEAICKLGLKAKILTHTRCTLEDAKLACDCGVDGVDVVIGTSQFLREHSLGGKDMIAITKQAIEVIEYIKSRGCEVRFSSEDSFRSDLVDLLSIYRAVNNVGVGRVGVADTVGCASPRQVYDLVRTLRGCVSTDIEVHFHDDTGCAVANSFTALEAGATHVDTSVLGIGERNGICPLGALMARMMPTSRDYILSKYKLHQLKAIEDFVAEAVEINVPFNNPITGFCAFTHKAGIHAKAILNSPSTYEILKPEDFGLSSVHFTSRLTGWNAIKSRVDQLGLDANSWPEDKIRQVTAKIKQMADLKVMTLDETDALIRSFHLDLQKGHSSNGQNGESVEKAT